MGALSTVHDGAERRCRECERLRAELDETRERLRQIDESLSGRALRLPVHLTPTEMRIVTLLLKRRSVTREQVLTVVYGDPGKERGVEPKVLDVFIYRLRQKLAPYGVSITTRFAVGYDLDKDSHERLRAMAGAEEAVAC